MKPYVLVTAARNEAEFIERTLRAVISQSVLPSKWIIVSDSSTDGMDAIVERYVQRHDFIHLIRHTGDQERNFGSKVRAISKGYEYLKKFDFDFIGNLDADISFEPGYYENILSKFEANPRLGIAGGVRFDLIDGRFRRMNAARNSVGGPIQFFRHECYEIIGGYHPYRFGGVDAVAEIMARMYGWEVETFQDLRVFHYRCTGTAGGNIYKGNFRKGIQHYVIGYHPLFQIASCIFRLFGYPLVLGSLATLSGYFWAAFKKMDIVVPDDVLDYLQNEQKTRLRKLLIMGT
jgi:glycosyltransferase involved in cell wall biosynthesis